MKTFVNVPRKPPLNKLLIPSSLIQSPKPDIPHLKISQANIQRPRGDFL